MSDPEKIREQNREAARRYRERHPERVQSNWSRYREANPDKVKESQLRWLQANPEKRREIQRRSDAKRDPERRRESQRRSRAKNPYAAHGLRPDEVAAMLAEQNGCCYLCEEPLAFEDIHIDHDHRCCPQGASCPYCHRGLAHGPCNRAIGMAQDDPEQLRRMADNLEVAIAKVTIRLHEKPAQLSLVENEEAS